MSEASSQTSNNSTRKVTQRDVAQKAGVSRSTVTYALKGNPKIPEMTRKRIARIAKELGYAPDPMLASLANYRNRNRPHAFHGVLAWIVLANYDFQSSPHYRRYFEAAVNRAPYHGYKLEKIHVDPAQRNFPSRTAAMLNSRGISGILICPLPHADTHLKFVWKKFSVVALGYTLATPGLNDVASAIFQNVRLTLAELRHRGYQRIGMAINSLSDLRCKRTATSCFFGEQNATNPQPISRWIPIHPESYESRTQKSKGVAQLEAYIRRHRLDALITDDHLILKRLANTSLSIPADLGVASINLPEPDAELSGIVERTDRVGSLAVDLLVAMLQRGERGVPISPVHSYVEGIWNEGTTLRPSTTPHKHHPLRL